MVERLTIQTDKTIETLALYTKTHAEGTISPQLLSEIESKSWIKITTPVQEKAILLAKTVIMREMIVKGKP